MPRHINSLPNQKPLTHREYGIQRSFEEQGSNKNMQPTFNNKKSFLDITGGSGFNPFIMSQ